MKDKILKELKNEFPDLDIDIFISKKVQFLNQIGKEEWDRIAVTVNGEEFAIVEEHPANWPITVQTIIDKIKATEPSL